ncbi:MAG: signal peptidase II [Planctomycetes bacterium]|nr:signal peptidase II [Planctomycetota bacterium]
MNEQAPTRRSHLLFVLVFLIGFGLDLSSKELVEANFQPIVDRHVVWEGVFEIRLITNEGMMWSMATEVPPHWWVIIRGSVLLGLIWLYAGLERKSRLAQLSFGLVCAGALGNVWDNVFQNPAGLFEGHVRDFLHFYWFDFPTFNVADSCITIGAPLLLLVLWKHDRESARREA